MCQNTRKRAEQKVEQKKTNHQLEAHLRYNMFHIKMYVNISPETNISSF